MSDHHATFADLLQGPKPILALAPMQDVTDREFWDLISRFGGADVYYTEYFRVHRDSRLEKNILRSITANPTGKPAVAQMIGNDIPSLVRTAKELQQHGIVAVDLNLGCPAPIVYKKCAGGGLLREPQLVDRILGALREAVQIKFTVKTRIGFDNTDHFETFLALFAKHNIDLLTVHGRTVAEGYRSAVHYDFIARAVDALPCPVLANGNVSSARRGEEILKITGARGLMIGRGAIRNPWIFQQFRQLRADQPLSIPSGRDVLGFISALYDAVCSPDVAELYQVQKMKKYLNFVGLGVEPTGAFLHHMRRATSRAQLFHLCAEYLDHDDPMPLEPFRLELRERDVLVGEHS